MPAQPENWNIVIRAAWNPAILTPDGIRKRLFELPEGTPLQLEIAIDQPGRFRVIYDGVIVAPSNQLLEVAVQTHDLASLEKASHIGQTALKALPETPVAAAGINIRYTVKPLPDELIDLLKTPIDDAYSDEGFTISGALTQRSLAHPPGVVNVEISQGKEGDGTVLMNFHCASSSPDELRQWLTKASEFWEVAQRLLTVMKIPMQQETQQ